jgi:hypothetical protein
LQSIGEVTNAARWRNFQGKKPLSRFVRFGTQTAKVMLRNSSADRWGGLMNLEIWLPAMFILGLVTLGLMFVFVEACDKV